jgi:hypothetical protein
MSKGFCENNRRMAKERIRCEPRMTTVFRRTRRNIGVKVTGPLNTSALVGVAYRTLSGSALELE